MNKDRITGFHRFDYARRARARRLRRRAFRTSFNARRPVRLDDTASDRPRRSRSLAHRVAPLERVTSSTNASHSPAPHILSLLQTVVSERRHLVPPPLLARARCHGSARTPRRTTPSRSDDNGACSRPGTTPRTPSTASGGRSTRCARVVTAAMTCDSRACRDRRDVVLRQTDG